MVHVCLRNMHIDTNFGVGMFLEAAETGQKFIIVCDGGINVSALCM